MMLTTIASASQYNNVVRRILHEMSLGVLIANNFYSASMEFYN